MPTVNEMKKITVFIITLILTLSFFASCTPAEQKTNEKITVVTTVFPVYDWTRNIAGDKANVIYLDKSGTDMHSYQPTAADIVTLGSADVFIHVGGVSDTWVDGAIKSAQNESLSVLSLMDIAGGAEEQTVAGMQTEVHEHENDATELDEHIWLSLKKAQVCVNAIQDALGKADVKNSDEYKKNAENYNIKLADLDSRYEAMVMNSKRQTVLFADRFPFLYLTQDYGIEYFAAFPGCSAESEASFETVTFLIEKTKELNLPCIIILETSDSELANTVSSETGAKILKLNSCQSVTQKDIDSSFTYFSAMENNLNTFTEALN